MACPCDCDTTTARCPLHARSWTQQRIALSGYHDGGNSLSEMEPRTDWLPTHHPERPKHPPVKPPTSRGMRWNRAGAGAGAATAAAILPAAHTHHSPSSLPPPAALPHRSEKMGRMTDASPAPLNAQGKRGAWLMLPPSTASILTSIHGQRPFCAVSDALSLSLSLVLAAANAQ